MRLRKNWKYILRNRGRIFFLLPSLTGTVFFVILPFGKVVKMSFFTGMSGKFTGIENYISVLRNKAFRLAVGNTVKFMAVGLPLLLLTSLIFALMIESSPRFDKYKYMYLLPMAVPAAVMTLVWRLLFTEQGFLNQIMGTHINMLGEDGAFYILIGSYLWKNAGYTMILWIAGLKAIPRELKEAANVDGAGRGQIFLKITLPCLKGNMFTILIVSILNSFKAFREVYLVGGAYPQKKIYLIQNVFHNWYTNLEQDKLAAGVVMMTIVLGTVTLLLKRQWDKEGERG